MSHGTPPQRTPRWTRVTALVLPTLLLWGCSAPYYQRQADEQVYRIIQQIEQDVFGRTNKFTINTAWSDRDPMTVTPDEIIADRSATNRITLTISDALDLAVRNSRQYQSEKEGLYLTALTLTGDLHEFTPQFFAGSAITGTRFSNGDEQGRINSSVGVSQALKSGASIGVSIANDLLRYYTGDPRKSAVSSISVNIFQPLLRGAGSKVVAERLTQSERNVIYAIRDFSHFQNTFAVDIVDEYFNLLALKDRVRNEFSNYQSRTNTTIYLQERSRDRESPLDVEQARQQELAAKSTYINSIVSYDNALDRFKTTLGIPNGTDLLLDDNAFTELEAAGPLPINLDEHLAFQISLEHYLPLINDIDRFEDSQRKIYVAADRLKADLNIFADASLESDRPTDYANFDFDDVRAGVGIELDLPLDRLNERNDYRATLIDFESQLRSLGLSIDEQNNLIDQALRDIERLYLNYQIARESVLIAERRRRGTELEYEFGLSILRDVIDAQDDLIASQNAETQALVDYLTARLRLLLNLGILNTETDRFWLAADSTVVDLSNNPASSGVVFDGGEVLPPEAIFNR